MNALPIIAIVLALAGNGIAAYGFIETKPNLVSNEARMQDTSTVRSDKMKKLDRAVWQEYRDALSMEAYASLGLGIIALIMGAVASVKKIRPKLAGASAALGAISIVLSVVLGS